MPVISKPYYFVDKNNPNKRLDAIWRISYMAKIRVKREKRVTLIMEN